MSRIIVGLFRVFLLPIMTLFGKKKVVVLAIIIDILLTNKRNMSMKLFIFVGIYLLGKHDQVKYKILAK